MNILRQVTLADSLSVLNGLLGFSATIHILLNGLKPEAFSLFYLAVLADGADGLVASKTEKSPFGKELDSLADLVSFGVFPATAVVSFNPDLFPFAALIVAFSMLRLARFNVVKFEDFYGLPTLVCALIVTSLVRIGVNATILASAAVILSALMISDFVYPRVRDMFALLLIALVILSALVFDEMQYIILALGVIYTAIPALKGVLVGWRERKARQLLKQE